MPDRVKASRPKLPGAWTAIALTLVTLALAFRLSNVAARGAFADYDAHGHLMNTAAILNGSLPHPRSWSGHHPPLFYAIGALLVRLAPDSLPIHVTLRLLSLAAGLGALVWIWRILRRRFDPVDATVVSLFLGCTPVVVIATSMLGNETLCAFFVTATLAGLIDVPTDARSGLGRSVRTGVFAGLAALSKVTGLIVLAVAVGTELVRLRRDPRSAVGNALVLGTLPILILVPWLAWWVHWQLSPWAALSGASVSPDLNAVMSIQQTGARHALDYVRVPAAVFLEPSHLSNELNGSVFGLLYDSAWGDVHEHFFPARAPHASLAERMLAIGGVIPTALAAFGALRILGRPRRWAWAFAPLLYGTLLLAGFLLNTVHAASFSVVKASFLLSGLLPASLLLVAGLESLPSPWRSACRGALVALALLAVFTFWIPWWLP